MSGISRRTINNNLGILILCGAFAALSLLTAGWGLPQMLDSDEWIFVHASMTMLSEPYLHPGWFGAPAATLVFIQAVIYGFVSVAGWVIGVFDSPKNFAALYWYSDPIPHYYIGRYISAVFATLGLFLIYRLACRLTSMWYALAASLITASALLYVEFAVITRMDMLQISFLLATLLVCVNVIERGALTYRNTILASIFLSLAIFSKYPSVFVLPAVLFTVIAVKPTFAHTIRCGLLFGAVGLLTAFIVSPYFFLDFQQVLNDVIYEARGQHLSHSSEGFWFALNKYVLGTLPANLTIPGMLIGLLGITTKWQDRRMQLIIVTFFCYLAMIASLNLWWDRWVLPLVPLFAIFIAAGLNKIATFKTYGKAISLACAALVIGLNVNSSYALTTTRLTNQFTLLEAEKWLTQHLPAGTSIYLDKYAPGLQGDHYELRGFDCDEGIVTLSDRAKRVTTGATPYLCKTLSPELIDTISEKLVGIDYLVRSEIYDRLLHEPQLGEVEQRAVEIYSHMFSQFRLIKTISSDNPFAGGSVYIYQRSTEEVTAYDN